MRKLTIITILLFSIATVYSQEKNKQEKNKPDIDFAIELKIIGLNLEPKYKLSNKSTFGLRMGFSLLIPRTKKDIPNASFSIDNESELLPEVHQFNLTATYDYKYLGNVKIKFQPYLGGGIGFYKAASVEAFENKTSPTVSRRRLDINSKGQLGFVIRGGFEIGVIRMGLDLNLLSTADVKLPTGELIGTKNDSHINISLGFILK